MITVDDKVYENESEAPDLGSWSGRFVDKSLSNKRCYYGLSVDVPKLPKYEDLETGSTAYCLDTGDLYMYESHGSIWHLQ